MESLAGSLGISEKTIRRDIAGLKDRPQRVRRSHRPPITPHRSRPRAAASHHPLRKRNIVPVRQLWQCNTMNDTETVKQCHKAVRHLFLIRILKNALAIGLSGKSLASTSSLTSISYVLSFPETVANQAVVFLCEPFTVHLLCFWRT